jgi:hypothetical protein
LAVQVAESGIQSCFSQDVPWPCGTYEGVTPSLFLGLAGIGLFYLRLYDPAILSVLIVRPEAFGAATPNPALRRS